jgi:uncharacterized protein (DUF2236 family)
VNPVKRSIVDEYIRVSGRHDDPETYGSPAGDPGLIGPGSVSWEIHSDMSAIGIAGVAAIVLEIMHPSVMAGVHDRSSYRTKPFERARNTAGYVLATTFGGTEAAEALIGRVRRMHERVNGVRPDGVPYRATDPALLGWVHTSIPWAVMRTFERYNRALSPAERDRYLAEQAVIGRKAGAGEIPVTMSELDEYVEAMRPQLAVNEQTREFFGFLLESPLGARGPAPLARQLNRFQTHAGMSVMPVWARQLAGFDHPRLVQQVAVEPYLQLTACSLRWAFGVPPCRQLAEARVRAAASPRPSPLAIAQPA